MRILNYVVYTWSKYLRILNYALYTRVTRKCDSPFESVEKRHGCVWVACQSNMTCVVYVSFACAARGIIGGSAWLEGHTSSAPPKHDSEVKSFIHRFRLRDLRESIVTGKHLCTVIWDAHFKLRFATWFGIHTVFFCVFWILIKNAHLELKFKIRTLPSCENSLSNFKQW